MAEEDGILAKEVGDEEEDMDKLETELDQMAMAILESRATLSDLVSSTMCSILPARRPRATVSDPRLSDPADQGKREWGDRVVEEKTRLMKEKMARNVSKMRVVVERLRECTARTEKLCSSSTFRL